MNYKLKVFYPGYHITNGMFTKGMDILVTFSESIFEMVNDINDADIILLFTLEPTDSDLLMLNNCDFSSKLVIVLSGLMHSSEGGPDNHIWYKDWIKNLFTNTLNKDMPLTLIPHNNLVDRNDQYSNDFIYLDYLWNRQTTFYVNQPDRVFKNTNRCARNHWYPNQSDKDNSDNLNKSIYKLSDLDEKIIFDMAPHNGNLIKKYVSPNYMRNIPFLRTYLSGYKELVTDDRIEVRDILRNSLIEQLRNYPGHLGDRGSGAGLIGQVMDEASISQMISGHYYSGLGWYPIHNSYYSSSIFTIYVETITYGSKLRTITEKTWEPLIKGSFILPFGYSGMIADLKNIYGFKFPDWIDYKYDNVHNDLERWVKYCKTVDKMLSIPIDTLTEYKKQDVDILKHNRSVFFNNPYKDSMTCALKTWVYRNENLANHPVYEKIKNNINRYDKPEPGSNNLKLN